MKMKRPHKSRLEIRFQEQTALQGYDGEHGCKVRPYPGRDEVEPYTSSESREAAAWQELDNLPVDYAQKGNRVSLLDNEAVEGHKTYKRKLTMKSGEGRKTETSMKIIALWVLGGGISMAAVAGEPVTGQRITAAQIIEKNIAARGGQQAWRKIQTMVWAGHVESAHGPAAPNLPFVLEMKRPNKTRFEIMAQNQVSVRIYDGTHGWKLRPENSGKPEWQPYNAEELIFAGEGQGIGGPLMDFREKGIAVALDGIDEVEGSKAWRLTVKRPSGNTYHMWIDAKTFLDIKYDRESRNALAQSGTVSVYYRNYKTIDGLQIPLMLESGTATANSTGAAKVTDRMVIEKVALNPPLENLAFAKPGVTGRSNMVPVDISPPRATRFPPPGFPRPTLGSAPDFVDAK